MITSFVSFIFTVRENTAAAREILGALDDHFRENFERYELVLVCAGGGVDAKALRARADELRSLVHILELGHNTTFETAALVGLDQAIGDFVFFLEEAKLDFDLELIQTMMEKAYQNHDVVFLSSGAKILDPMSRAFYLVYNVFRSTAALGPARLVLVSRRALGYALDQNHLIRFHRILFLVGGFRPEIIPYREKRVENYEIKSFYDRVSLAKELLLYYTFLGRNLSFMAAGFFVSFAFAVLGYALYSYTYVGGVVSGWTSLMLILSIGFIGLFVLLGIVVEHLQKLLFNGQKRPVYNLKSASSNFEKAQVRD